MVFIIVSLWILVIQARPFTTWKVALVGTMFGLGFLAFAIPFGRSFYDLHLPTTTIAIEALALAAGQQKVALPPDRAIDAEVDLGTNDGGYQLRARLNVSLPGLQPKVAQALVDAAHQKYVPMKLEVQNVQTGHRTVIQISDYKVNQNVSDASFTARNMERGR